MRPGSHAGPRREAEPGSVLEVLGAALRLGLTSFGGPIAHLGYFHREYVERRHWLDEPTYADLVALCQSLPGPASSELGIAIGIRRAGLVGGVAAWLGFTLPSAIALILFALLTGSGDVSGSGWVHGLKIAAVAVVAQAVWTMSRALAPDLPRRAIALASTAIGLAIATAWTQVAIIVGGAFLGWLALEATPPSIGQGSTSPIGRRLGAFSLGAFLVLLVGLPLARLIGGGQPLALFDAFYRSGALVFGGGHVVLPLLHATVVEPGWVSDDRFLAGYGAAQAVPGPLFTFAAYLGAVSLVPPAGLVGAAIALVAIFLPAFLLVVGTLPFWDRLRGSAGFRRASAGTNAAVVGILLAALITPVATSAIAGPRDAVLAVAALALLMGARLPPLAVVALAAVAAQVLGASA